MKGLGTGAPEEQGPWLWDRVTGVHWELLLVGVEKLWSAGGWQAALQLARGPQAHRPVNVCAGGAAGGRYKRHRTNVP